MQLRGLIVAGAVLAGAGGLLYWSNRQEAKKASQPLPDASPEVLKLQAEQVQRLHFERPSQEKMILEREGSAPWKLTAPEALPVNPEEANSLLTALSSLKAERLIEEKPADPASFGLKEPALSLRIESKGGKAQILKLGDLAPAGGGQYAQVEGDARVFLLGSYVRSQVDKRPRDLRESRFLPYDRASLTGLELKLDKDNLVFAKDASGDWRITQPGPWRADGPEVDSLLGRLREAKMDVDSFQTPDQLAKAFAGALPLATVKIKDGKGAFEMEIRKPKEGALLAKGSLLGGPHRLQKGLEEAFTKKAEDFKNKALFDFGWTDPDEVEIQSGKDKKAYVRMGEAWKLGAQDIDVASIQALLDKLRDLKATELSQGEAKGEQVLWIKVCSNGRKREEKISIRKMDQRFLATREGEKTLYPLDEKLVTELQKAAQNIKLASKSKLPSK